MAEGVKGLNILCIDGGGARGLSSLVVLREIMHRVNSKRTRSQVPSQPHEHFDVIAGTGTGGISACMLGRLQMTIDRTIEEYVKLIEGVFSEKKMNGPTMYKGTKLQEALKTIVRNATKNEEEVMIEAEAKSGCRTVVFAMAKHNLNGSIPVMFRSYEATANPGPNCAIWQALYATMAHPDLFKGIDILDSSVFQSFIGGEVGCSNPLAHVLFEVSRVYPDRRVACIISIGAGHARTIQVPDPSWWQMITRTQDLVAMKDMATDSERVAEEMSLRFQGTSGVYYRFNVDQGVQDMKHGSWERLGEAVQHTNAYLQKGETNQRLDSAMKVSVKRLGTISTTHAAGQVPDTTPTETIPEPTQRSTKTKRCPAPTPVYTGREDENRQLISCITGTKDERRVCVVYGLGGVGKTQLVLSVVERTRDEWDHVLFVDASSNATAEGDLKDFATAKGIGTTHDDTIGWLESCRERWLVVFDNADTPSTNIRQYIPSGRRGVILITTRLPDLARLAKGPGSVQHLSSMTEASSLALVMKIACTEDQRLPEAEVDAAKALLKDCGYLALAIVHSGAYLAHTPGMTFTTYRTLFMSQRQRMLEQYRDLPPSAKLDEYGQTVYTTWRMCYDQLKPESRRILWLISYLHHSHIFEDIFQRAARRVHRNYLLPPSERESHARSHVEHCLSSFLNQDQHWDTVGFANVMADLTSYSLLNFDRTNLTYSIHVLVQDWARTVIPQEPALAIECSVTLISRSIDWKSDTESLAFTRRLMLHVVGLLERCPKLGANHTSRFARVFGCTGQWSEMQKLELALVEVFQRELGEEHEETLAAMSSLAVTYRRQGRLNEAEKIHFQVLDTRRRRLGEDDPSTLSSMGKLAVIYGNQGRWDEAERLLVQNLSAYKRLLGEDHPDTLGSMDQLATLHYRMGRHREFAQLELQILEGRKRVLGEEHPRTLGSMAKLGIAYSHLDRWDEAISLLSTASAISQVLLGPDHFDTRNYLIRLAKVKKHEPA